MQWQLGGGLGHTENNYGMKNVNVTKAATINQNEGWSSEMKAVPSARVLPQPLLLGKCC